MEIITPLLQLSSRMAHGGSDGLKSSMGELPGKTYEGLIISLKETLAEALRFNREVTI